MSDANELHEMKQAGLLYPSPRTQLDWRWIERYRRLCAYDSYWWLTWAGPFSDEEQQEWDHLFAHPLDETTRAQLSKLMNVARERELAAAIAEQREPHLRYPAIEIEDIRHRIAAQRALQEEIRNLEPNAIVRRLYVETIEEELDYLHLIEATYEGNSERFWACNLRLFPKPPPEYMRSGLARIKHLTRQGLEHPRTAEISEQVQEFVHTRLHLSLELTPEEEAHPERIQEAAASTTPPRTLSVEAARRFFTQVLPNGPRVAQRAS
jgi:hypothetical protein